MNKEKLIIEIPEGATNGDMIKAIFPNAIIENENSNIVDISISHDNCVNAVVISAKQNWWNAPYREESEG